MVETTDVIEPTAQAPPLTDPNKPVPRVAFCLLPRNEQDRLCELHKLTLATLHDKTMLFVALTFHLSPAAVEAFRKHLEPYEAANKDVYERIMLQVSDPVEPENPSLHEPISS